MGEEIELTEAERIAKDHFLFLLNEGTKFPCDFDLSAINDGLPSWYDEVLYKRGQKYYQENRAGIMYSNLIGLICLLAEPRGLAILQSTGRSSTPETARKRYVSTITHTLTWYDYDLSPGSKSFESLKKVRKLHYLASKSSGEKGSAIITQADIAMTTFGFMGFVLIRPHILGIRADNEEDRKAFVHFWAVLCYILGLEDRFNFCLLPFDALLVICQMIMRYILLPIIQLESPDFKDMAQAMLTGMKKYLHNVNYEVDIFFAKRLLIVPGYQYKTDNSLEVHCRSLLTQKDIDECNASAAELLGGVEKSYLSVDIPIIEVTRGQGNNSLEVEVVEPEKNSVTIDINAHADKNKQKTGHKEYLHSLMELGPSEHVSIRYINYENDWQSNLNDSQFNELSSRGKLGVRLKLILSYLYHSRIGRYLTEGLLGMVLFRIQKANENYHTSSSKHIQTA